jgi:hypothetical protein
MMPGSLAELSIRLRRETPGEHRGPCPKCASEKPRKGDDALAVKVEPGGSAMWLCHRCGWKGALGTPGELQRSSSRQTGPSRASSRAGALTSGLL